MPAPRCDAAIRLTLAWAVTHATLLLVTWPLWTPQRGVPRIAPLVALPAALEFGLLFVIAIGLVSVCLAPTASRRGVRLATIALLVLVGSDQLRWQPWAYHALLVGTVLALCDARRAFIVLRLLAIAVYAYSAIAKLDAEFVATLGQQMLSVLLRPFGVGPSSLGGLIANAAALALPISELVLAVLLAAAWRWQRLAMVACIATAVMHATTIVVLGPWGLGHSLGVLLWNVGFVWQTIVLFASSLPDREEVHASSRSGSFAAATVILLGVVAPLGTPFGLWDQWPGWALYAPGGERATLFVHSAATDRLPESLLPHVESTADADSPWRRVSLDDWVLEATNAPIYPQNRVVAAIAAGLLDRYPLGGRVRVVAESRAGPLSRKRQLVELTTRDEIEAASALLGLRPTVDWSR
ncbi:MAG: hypothetical protein AAF266_08705 [Planctomycetota bacterium]